MNKTGRYGTALAALMALALPLVQTADASVIINGTRVIYPAQAQEVTVKLDNNGAAPSLVQAWIDDGDVNTAPDQSTAPFTITPPLFRLDPQKSQSLRLIYTQEPLPMDQESLFWLNVLEVPPKDTGRAQANVLRMAFRSRIKLFFRPAELIGEARDAPAKLSWQFVRQGEHYALRASNPTPYHVTLGQIVAKAGENSWRNDEGGMIAPNASADFPVDATPSPQEPFTVEYRFIDDYGSAIDGKYQSPRP